MARPTKEYEFLHCKLEKKISEDLQKLCDESHLTKTAAVERALEEYIKIWWIENGRQQVGVGTQRAIL